MRSGDYDNILFIDATSSPLGDDDFDTYVEYSAMANYYQGNNNPSARENANKAKQILSIIWKNRIYNGLFTIWSKDYPDGEKVSSGSAVSDILQTVVLKNSDMCLILVKDLRNLSLSYQMQKRLLCVALTKNKWRSGWCRKERFSRCMEYC